MVIHSGTTLVIAYLAKENQVTLVNNEIIFCGSRTPIQPTNVIPKSYYLVGGLDINRS